MARKSSCSAAKAANLLVRRKINAALIDIKKGRPKAGGIKLHEAAALIAQPSIRKAWPAQKKMNLGNEAFYVGSQLMKPSMMNWPKWKDRVSRLLDNVDLESTRSTSRCK